MLPLHLLVLLLTPAVVHVLISPSSTSCSTVLLPYLRWHLLPCALCISHISMICTLWVLFCIFLVILVCSLRISYAAWIHLGSTVMPKTFYIWIWSSRGGSVVRTPASQREGPGLVSDGWLGPLYLKSVCSPLVCGFPLDALVLLHSPNENMQVKGELETLNCTVGVNLFNCLSHVSNKHQSRKYPVSHHQSVLHSSPIWPWTGSIHLSKCPKCFIFKGKFPSAFKCSTSTYQVIFICYYAHCRVVSRRHNITRQHTKSIISAHGLTPGLINVKIMTMTTRKKSTWATEVISARVTLSFNLPHLLHQLMG